MNSCIKALPRQKHILKKVGFILLILLAFFFLYIYAKFDPSEAPFPKCLLFWTTGVKCPGCGSQRALHSLLHLDIAGAFHYNAALILLLPVIFFLVLAYLLQDRFPRLYSLSHRPILSWGLLVFILLWGLLRNIFGW
ncbi:MAG: DUF2752 domain-containing protein [Candidatus Cryptobacteroides sp.]